ncbi:hypothetical protein OR263_19055 [Streptomyces sp. NEAU-H22]|uniref:hypothetical protein n=1 Tax=unclassified Streptomyces TaxID=2593676 RepID=UPI0022554AE2|nr:MULTISPECIES: hypothetical protein [unclassified Streptomyces]MCX3288779.1 hypothetical protein [Streptomyces sp. NEAU-H22]WMD05186.1 hypothetical protein Q7C01_12575 [Streptomyces sp. FXY-T5]
MAMLAVLIPLLMLGVVLVLGRYEELLLPQEDAERREPAAPAAVAATPSPAPAVTPAPSP